MLLQEGAGTSGVPLHTVVHTVFQGDYASVQRLSAAGLVSVRDDTAATRTVVEQRVVLPASRVTLAAFRAVHRDPEVRAAMQKAERGAREARVGAAFAKAEAQMEQLSRLQQSAEGLHPKVHRDDNAQQLVVARRRREVVASLEEALR